MTSTILYPQMGTCVSSYRQDKHVMNSNFFGCIKEDSKHNNDKNIIGDKIRNPFFVDVKDDTFDMNSLNSSSRILVVCPTKIYDSDDTSLLVDKYITEKYLNECSKLYTIKLVDTPGKLELVGHHRDSTVSVSGELLQRFNHTDINLQKIETVVCIFDLKESDLNLYLTIFHSEHNVEDLIKLSVMMERFNSSKHNNSVMNSRLSQIITGVSDTIYWENPEKFKDVNFVTNSGITKQLITELFMTKTVNSNERIMYDYFNTFLMSKEYCHLVLNNVDVLKIMAPLIEKFKPIYKLLMGYAWLGMVTEETSKGEDLTLDNRVVFDIDTARQLPVFPFSSYDIHMNPYNTVQQSSTDIKKNYLGLEMLSSVDGIESSNSIYANYGITEYSDFKTRFNLITTRKAHTSILDGFQVDEDSIKPNAGDNIRSKWKDIIVTGSLIVECSKKKDMRKYMIPTYQGQNDKDQYTQFIDEYNTYTTLNIVCTNDSVFDYIDTVTKILKVVKKNLLLVNSEDKDDPTEELDCTCSKTVNIFVTNEYIKQCMPDHSVEDVRDNFKDSTTKASEISEHFFWRYNEEKRKRSTTMKDKRDKANTYNDYFTPVNFKNMKVNILENDKYKDISKHESDFYIYINDVLPDKDNVPEKDNFVVMIMKEIINYSIISSLMDYHITIRKTTSTNILTETLNYHLPCDRGLYDGGNVYFTPSVITSMMTNLNINCNACNCESASCKTSKIIEDALNSGYGTIQSANQLQTHTIKPDNIGAIKLNKDYMFCPKSFESMGYANPIVTYVNTKNDFYNMYKKLYNYNVTELEFDVLKLKAINKEGQVVPFKRWWLDAGYDSLSK